MDLCELWDDNPSRREKAARHEAGHACFAMALSGGNGSIQVFREVQIDQIPNQSGVVPGGVAVVSSWFNALETVDKATVLLGGWYAQEGYALSCATGEQLDDACCEKLNDNSDCTDDIKRVLKLEPTNEPEKLQFWDALLSRFRALWSEERVTSLADALVKRSPMSWSDVIDLLQLN